MRIDQERRTYHTLDGLRGIAAAIVLLFHCPEFTHGVVPASSYMAVDLFYLLSGFIIARVYEPRLAAGMGAWRFMQIRLVRLYPVYILGTVLGLLVTAASLKLMGNGLGWTASDVVKTVPFAAFMLPAPPLSGKTWLYPFDAPAWSILFEVVINLLYVLMWRRLGRWALAALLGLGALGLAAAAFKWGTLGLGADWGTVAGGVPRVVFSFFLGVLLARAPPLIRPRVSSGWAWGLIAIAFGLLAVKPPSFVLWQLALVFAAFPLLIALAIQVEPGPRSAWAFRLLGTASYAIYLLSVPMYHGILGLHRKLHLPSNAALDYGFALFTLALVALVALAVDRWYDTPVRAWLNSRLSRTVRPRVAGS